MELREAVAEDCRHVWEIASAPETRRWSFSVDPIPYEDHVRWFDKVLASPDRILLVAVEDSRLVGYVRFDREDGRSTISIAVRPDLHGRGVGRRILSAALDRYEHRPVVAEVQQDNAASHRLFSSWSDPSWDDEVATYVLT